MLTSAFRGDPVDLLDERRLRASERGNGAGDERLRRLIDHGGEPGRGAAQEFGEAVGWHDRYPIKGELKPIESVMFLLLNKTNFVKKVVFLELS